MPNSANSAGAHVASWCIDSSRFAVVVGNQSWIDLKAAGISLLDRAQVLSADNVGLYHRRNSL